MNSILFATDYGNGLGDLTAFLPVAGELRKRGWHVAFAIPHISDALGLVTQIIESEGFEYFEVMGTTARFAPTLARRIDSCPSFANVETLRHDLDFWFAQLHRLQPALLIAGRAVFAILAATLANVRCFALDTGIFHDLPAHDTQDSEACKRDQIATEHVLRLINMALPPDGRQPLRRLVDLYRIEQVLRVSIPALLDASPTARPRNLGVIPMGRYGSHIDWPLDDLTRPRLFACLRMQLSNTATILETLAANASLNVIASIPDVTLEMRKRYSRSHLTIVDIPVDVRALLAETDAVICHGSAAMLNQTLSMGKPLLLAPANQEQQAYAVAAIRHKVAVAIPPGSNCDLIRKRLENLLSGYWEQGRTSTAYARSISRKCEQADVVDIAAAINTAAQFSAAPATAQAASLPLSQPASVSDVSFADYDVIFLSYDEPDAEARWNALKLIAPQAQRVHGVPGFDAAHKAAADASRSERFILVDGDNLLDERFFAIRTRVPRLFADGIWQWCSVNNVSGLAYPFGGVKIWTRTRALSMHTHEACADRDAALATDFWALPGYYTFRRVFSINLTNDSPYQAFRAGFREGNKLAGWNGLVRSPEEFLRIAGMPQSRRAIIWMSVGVDVPNGRWSMLGARLGFLSHFQQDIHQSNIGEYAWFDAYWRTFFGSIGVDPHHSTGFGPGEGQLETDAMRDVLGEALREAGSNIEALFGKPLVVDMTEEQSARFKLAMQQRRSDALPLFSPFGLSHGF